jgi:hypothetical protein
MSPDGVETGHERLELALGARGDAVGGLADPRIHAA